MPGVLQVAAMVQVGGALLRLRSGGADGRIAWCRELSRIKFRAPVYPGDRMVVTAELKGAREDGGVMAEAQVRVGDTVVSQGHFVIRLEDPATLTVPPQLLAPCVHEPPDTAASPPVATADLIQSIPHRYPFLLIDRICHLDTNVNRCVGLKNVTGNESFFAGTSVAAVPGWLQVESAAQVGCSLALAVPENRGKLGIFMSIDEARFLTPVIPGDQLVIDLSMTGARGRFGRAEARLYVGERVVTEVTLKFAIIDRAENGAGGAGRAGASPVPARG